MDPPPGGYKKARKNTSLLQKDTFCTGPEGVCMVYLGSFGMFKASGTGLWASSWLKTSCFITLFTFYSERALHFGLQASRFLSQRVLDFWPRLSQRVQDFWSLEAQEARLSQKRLRRLVSAKRCRTFGLCRLRSLVQAKGCRIFCLWRLRRLV